MTRLPALAASLFALSCAPLPALAGDAPSMGRTASPSGSVHIAGEEHDAALPGITDAVDDRLLADAVTDP